MAISLRGGANRARLAMLTGWSLVASTAAVSTTGPAAYANPNWSSPVEVSLDDTWDADDPQVAVSRDGAFVAIWSQDIGSGDPVIKASRSTDGTNWSTPAVVSKDGD